MSPAIINLLKHSVKDIYINWTDIVWIQWI